MRAPRLGLASVVSYRGIAAVRSAAAAEVRLTGLHVLLQLAVEVEHAELLRGFIVPPRLDLPI